METIKRRDLINEIEKEGAKLKRNGGNHDVYELNGKRTAIPRHREIDEELVKKIKKQLGL